MDSLFIFLENEVLHKPIWMWLVFTGLVFGLLALDLGVFNRKDHEIGIKESLILSAFYITIALIFGGWIYWELGERSALEYYTGFVVEKTLAMDNIFVIALIFSYLGIPRLYQHRVLFWGILGVVVLRGLMIGFGTVLVEEFEWILYLFGAFLIFTGVKMLFSSEEETDVSQNFVLKFLHKHFRVTEELHGNKFLIRQPVSEGSKPVLFLTPLLVALAMIEIADVVFAVDSIPAIFAITTDTYVVYTSNIFAILGLRALYFTLAAMLARFIYLKYALSLVLVFIGAKIFLKDFHDIIEITPSMSLSVTLGVLAGGIILSLWKTKSEVEPEDDKKD